MVSSGVCSAVMAERVCSRRHPELTHLVFTDTRWEDEDNYRFLDEVVARLQSLYNVEYVCLSDGRTPEQVFIDLRYLGNDRVPLCSRVLKQEQTAKWVEDGDVLYFGIEWHEDHRCKNIAKRYADIGVLCEFPLCETPFLSSAEMRSIVECKWGIKRPRMYELGFSHSNCGGRCIRGKKGHYAHLHRVWPERYRAQEDMEQKVSDHLGKTVTILRETKQPNVGDRLPLEKFRREVLEPAEMAELNQLDLFDADEYAAGPCVCFGVED